MMAVNDEEVNYLNGNGEADSIVDTSPMNPSVQINSKLVLVVAAFAAFLATFNETYLNVAFAPIMSSLSVGVNTVQWLATGYMLAAAVMVPISAFAYRRIPTRPLFCGTCAFLVIGSIVAAVAPNFGVLLTGRVIQALGTGLLIPIGMNITLEIAPREKLGTYMGIMGAMTTLGPSLSVITAGLLLAVFDWNILLWVFAGLSLICLLMSAAFLRNIAKLTHPHFDVASVIMIGLALVGILYGISSAFGGTLLASGVSIVIGIVFLILFIYRQNRIPEPLIDLRPLKVPPFAIGVVINMLSLITIFSMNILIPTFMQNVLGISSLISSVTLFPAILMSCILSPLAGRIYDRKGPRALLLTGFALIAVFAALVSIFISSQSMVVIALLYIPVIAGSALIIGPVQSFALSKLSPEIYPHGVTVMSTGFQIAGCIGSSVFVGIYSAVEAAYSAGPVITAEAAAMGMLIAGISVSVCAVIGFGCAIAINRYAKRPAVQIGVGAEASLSAVGAETELTLYDVMKTDVFVVHENQSVLDALTLFSEKGVSGTPVLNENGKVTGFISDGDIMNYLANQNTDFKSVWSFVIEQENLDFEKTITNLLQKPVSTLSTKRVISVDEDASVGEVCRVLAEYHLKKVPVMKGSELIGIVNRSTIAHRAINVYVDNHKN
ncbi:MAG: MFS transporter [Eggerthellaceae bacterium]|nr:MFS transporter [Eggerthellaceae bacterium]